jgi:polysaccharide pyruvyl transferase WcaK-like protein
LIGRSRTAPVREDGRRGILGRADRTAVEDMTMHRRDFLRAGGLGAVLPLVRRRVRAPRVVLRSSWQTVNIGDVGHTPGVLRLLENFLPEAEVRLWPGDVGGGVEAMLRHRFPRLRFVRGEGQVKEALAECDLLLHGSGPSLVAAKDVERWRRETGKPYGVYGITVADLDDRTVDLLSGARFAYFRDSVSLAHAKARGVAAPTVGFAPDGAFAADVHNGRKAEEYLNARGFATPKYLCCIPRLRFTPYWSIKPNHPFDARKQARNEAMQEHDHAPLREAIARVVRETDWKVLVCPEDASQMAVGKAMLVDPLPADVRKRVVWRESFWLTDEAVSTYERAGGLFGNEMHSPIMALGQGVPAIVCRFAEQTSKGVMWRDIGLGDWLFDLDDPADLPRIPPAVLALATDREAALAKAAGALARVADLQRETMAVVRAAVLDAVG